MKKGVRSVTYQSGSVTYNSLAEMLQLRDVMKAEVAGKSAITRTAGAYNNGLSHGFLDPDRYRR